MAVFIKITENFHLSTSTDEDTSSTYKPIVKRFKKVKPDTMDIYLDIDESTIGFKCGESNKVSGDLSMQIDGENVKVECDAIFKINIRPQHKDNFLSGDGSWKFRNLMQGEFGDDVVGDVTQGLEVKKYKRENRFGTMEMTDNIMNNVKTASKKTDLK